MIKSLGVFIMKKIFNIVICFVLCTCFVSCFTNKNENTTVIDYSTNAKNMHLSFDDTILCFENLSKNNYSTIFEEPFFNKLLNLHNEYGAIFSLYTYNSTLNNVPNTFINDFSNNSSWLKIGFHSDSMGLNLSNANYEDGFNYWNNFVDNVIRICGTTNSLDRYPRLEFFSGSYNALIGMRDANNGALGFLSSDDSRLSYYFSNDIRDYLYNNDYYNDLENNLVFFSTDIRGDWFYNFSSSYNYKKPVKNNVYNELIYRNSNDNFKSSFEYLIVFTHEFLVYNGTTINNKINTISDACKFAKNFNVAFNFVQDFNFTSNQA